MESKDLREIKAKGVVRNAKWKEKEKAYFIFTQSGPKTHIQPAGTMDAFVERVGG